MSLIAKLAIAADKSTTLLAASGKKKTKIPVTEVVDSASGVDTGALMDAAQVDPATVHAVSSSAGSASGELVDTVNVNVDDAALQAVQQTAGDWFGSIGHWFGQIDWVNPSWDTFIVIFFLVSSLLYGVSLGRDRIIVILVSIYMALAAIYTMPEFVLNITVNGQYAFQVGAFIAIFVALFFILSRSALMRTIGLKASNGRWYQTLIFSFLHVGVLLAITLSFLPEQMIIDNAPLTHTLFTHEWALFLWIIGPIVAMIVFGSREKADE